MREGETSSLARVPDRPGGGNLALGGASRDTLRCAVLTQRFPIYAGDAAVRPGAATGFMSMCRCGLFEFDSSDSICWRTLSIFG